MCLVKASAGSPVRLHGMDSRGGAVKMGEGEVSSRCGYKKNSGNGSSKEVVSEEVRGPGTTAVSNS